MTTIVMVVGLSLSFQGINNMPTFHLYSILSFAFLSYLFSKLLTPKWLKWTILTNISYFVLYAAINAAYVQGIYEFNSYVITSECIALIAYSLLYLRQLLRELSVKRVEGYFSFWLASGILFYNAGNYFLFLFANQLQQNPAIRLSDYWDIHSVNLMLYYAAFTVALLLKSGRKTHSAPIGPLKMNMDGPSFHLNH